MNYGNGKRGQKTKRGQKEPLRLRAKGKIGGGYFSPPCWRCVNTHNTTQHNTTQHNTTQHNTTQHNTKHKTQHNTTHQSTTQHSTTQETHHTTHHNTTEDNTRPHHTTLHHTTPHHTTPHHTTLHHTIRNPRLLVLPWGVWGGYFYLRVGAVLTQHKRGRGEVFHLRGGRLC